MVHQPVSVTDSSWR